MTKTAAQKRLAALRSRDIRVTVMRMIHPDTGELLGCLVPDHAVDRRSMKERKFHVGKQLRASLRQDRNPGFWRKAHLLGGWLADNVEAYSGLDQHAALKKLQEASGIGCDEETYSLDLGAYGLHTGTRRVPRSLNFDDMDEGEWNLLWDGGTGEGGWIGWLRREVFGGLDQASREEVEELIRKPEQGA